MATTNGGTNGNGTKAGLDLSAMHVATVNRGGGGGGSARTGIALKTYTQKKTGMAVGRVAMGADMCAAHGITRGDKRHLATIEHEGAAYLVIAKAGTLNGATFTVKGDKANEKAQRIMTSPSLLAMLTEVGVEAPTAYMDLAVNDDLSTDDMLVAACPVGMRA